MSFSYPKTSQALTQTAAVDRTQVQATAADRAIHARPSRAFVAKVLLLATMLTLAFSAASFGASLAWADDETPKADQVVESSGNTVNVNQMPDSSFLYNTEIKELSGAEAYHDAQQVQVRGEVVGDRINDESVVDLYWITLQSTSENDYSTVATLMTKEQTSLIDSYGGYKTTGTELQVRGTFYLSCPEHQGLSDIHANEVTVIHSGGTSEHPINPGIAWQAVLVLGLGVLCFVTYCVLRERRK